MAFSALSLSSGLRLDATCTVRLDAIGCGTAWLCLLCMCRLWLSYSREKQLPFLLRI